MNCVEPVSYTHLLYAIIFAIVCIAVSSYAVYASYSFAKKQREKVYVLDPVSYTHLDLLLDGSFTNIHLGRFCYGFLANL